MSFVICHLEFKMFFLLFIIASDSLPPLPDFSQTMFPEPPLWIGRKENSLTLSGYAGDFFAGNCDLNIQYFNISTYYKQIVDWDSLKYGSIITSYSIPMPHLFLTPSIYGYFLQRENNYKLLSPGVNFSSTIPWAIISGGLNVDVWQINKANYIEEQTKLEIIFDRMIYLPHFEITTIYTNSQLHSMLTGKLHIRNFHLAISSPTVHGFPTPSFTIQYLNPKIKLETEIKTGCIYKTLKDHLNPYTPLKYAIPMPDESLKVGVNFNAKLDLGKHQIGVFNSVKNWNSRPVPGEDFEITSIKNVKEINISVMLKNQFANKLIRVENDLHFNYNWTDTTIAFLAEYAIYDTFKIYFGVLDISLETEYLSKRDGIYTEMLSPVLIINPNIGLKYKFLRIFASVYNLTDDRKEIFDHYFLNHRQYAGGLEIDFRF